jgi:hypothetical protein
MKDRRGAKMPKKISFIANFGNEKLPTLEMKNCQLWK